MNTTKEQNQNWIEPDSFTLEAITSSKAKTMPPQRVIIYGTPGIGKTTFASTFPNPILLRLENGASTLDIPTFPQIARTLQDIDNAYRALRYGEHNFKTLVVDSLDWLEPIVWDNVCQSEGKSNIEDFGYGKGYVKADDSWKLLRSKLDALCNHVGMDIVLIAHAVAVNYDPPDMDSYQRYSLKLHKRANAIWTEWADMLLFVNWGINVVKKDDERKGKAKGVGSRIIYTEERPAYQAKNRWDMPHSIEIGNDPTWISFHEILNECVNTKLNKE